MNAHPRPTTERSSTCQPYIKGDRGYCSEILGNRLVYGSTSHQEKMEDSLTFFATAKTASPTFNFSASKNCLRVVRLIYCNQHFKECDDASAVILPRPVCREACEAMVQRHCREEWPKIRDINKMLLDAKGQTKPFYLMNCTALPRMDGGTVPECNYPKGLLKGISSCVCKLCTAFVVWAAFKVLGIVAEPSALMLSIRCFCIEPYE